MDYFRILNLNREPFSNSPDPAFFFHSRQHQGCLQKLELSLRMRRGLSVVIGDVGTGKTTLCREVIRKFAQEETIETHLILDPDFSSPGEFLAAVAEMFQGAPPPEDADDRWIKERIKKHIYRQGVDEEKLLVLIIDEGQKIPVFCLEILREFLNYETNEYKLLQIVIFAQKEFDRVLETHANFADRVNLYHLLEPLNFRDSRMMIRFRVQRSSRELKTKPIFTYMALWAIYRATAGYPRKIINLCHQTVLAMIIQNRNRANWFLVRSCIHRALARPPLQKRWKIAAAAGAMALIAVSGFGVYFQDIDTPMARFSGPDTAAHHRVDPNRVKTWKVEKVSAETPSDPVADPTIEPADAVSLSVVVDDAIATEIDKRQHQKAAAESPETAGEKPDAPEPVFHQLPSALGQVAPKRGDTLSWMCIKIYGFYNRKILKTLVAANPDLGNPNNIHVGQAVVFPADSVSARPVPVPVWWVKIDETDTLGGALDIVRGYRGSKTPIRIVPCWNPAEGLRFFILLWRFYFDEVSAVKQRDRLAVAADKNGAVFSKWPEQTVFFADPFLGGSG